VQFFTAGGCEQVDGGYYSKAPDNLPLIGPAAGEI